MTYRYVLKHLSTSHYRCRYTLGWLYGVFCPGIPNGLCLQIKIKGKKELHQIQHENILNSRALKDSIAAYQSLEILELLHRAYVSGKCSFRPRRYYKSFFPIRECLHRKTPVNMAATVISHSLTDLPLRKE